MYANQYYYDYYLAGSQMNKKSFTWAFLGLLSTSACSVEKMPPENPSDLTVPAVAYTEKHIKASSEAYTHSSTSSVSDCQSMVGKL